MRRLSTTFATTGAAVIASLALMAPAAGASTMAATGSQATSLAAVAQALNAAVTPTVTDHRGRCHRHHHGWWKRHCHRHHHHHHYNWYDDDDCDFGWGYRDRWDDDWNDWDDCD